MSKLETFGTLCAFFLFLYVVDMVPDNVKVIGWKIFLLCFIGAGIGTGILNLIDKKKAKREGDHEEKQKAL